jgi:hypothetical protein
VAFEREWLEGLPQLADPESGVIRAYGVAVGAPAGRLRLLLAETCIDLSLEDVVSLETVGAESDRGAVPVEAVVRAGAPVLALQDGDALQLGESFGTETFPYRTRRDALSEIRSPVFDQLEREYLQRWNLAS